MKEVVIKSKIVGKVGATGGGKPVAFPDLSAYALRSDFLRLESSFNDFLEGDDTDNVINRWKELEAFLDNISEDYNLLAMLNGKADKATTLSGYGITDAYTKTNVDDLLKAYVTLSGTQTITGEKNFTGGLKVNGSPIYYDSAKKYWKLEGDLLVTGGVTMYGSDSSFVPSTIMDALLYDDTTLGINSNGQLYVKGGASGGGLDITALQNYLTQNSYLNVTSGDNRYLKLSGGIINGGFGALDIKRNESAKPSLIKFTNNDGTLGMLGMSDNYEPIVYKGSSQSNPNTIWHSGNDGSGSGLDADLLDGKHDGDLTAKYFSVGKILTSSDTINKLMSGVYCYINGNNPVGAVSDNAILLSFRNDGRTDMFQLANSANEHSLYYRSAANIGNSYENWSSWRAFAFTDSNVASATKLQTARTIWGQSFDGTGNVSGMLKVSEGNAKIYWQSDSNNYYIHCPAGNGGAYLEYAAYGGHAFLGGNVGIGTTSAQATFSVYGNIDLFRPNTSSYGGAIAFNRKSMVGGLYNTSFHGFQIHNQNGNLHFFIERTNTYQNTAMMLRGEDGFLGLGTENPSNKFHVKLSSGHVVAQFESALTTQCVLSYKKSDGIEWAAGIGIRDGGDNFGFWSTTAQKCIMSIGTSGDVAITSNKANIISLYRTTSGSGAFIDYHASNSTNNQWRAGSSGEYRFIFNHFANGVESTKMTLDTSSNLLVYGGITMHSDQRKKTILNHVELSLKQIAEAPLIEHYYNSDDKKTTHVGSIAQYWASMNDWFCKLDSEGYYTMEIQNAALASAISIARELDRYETKTDKAIKKLKKRISELEDEVERLKCA